ncbi:argonaute/piwi family protein [Methylibium petroleiphilum]|uniref:Protein argonaute n=1 Tax=Methylibium petroleiphilum (strain ATCC BAA-1232 / LMG 22953 / PM1) TaxID=420662 RepID=A2SMU4_METPP|nr:hypothetical protein [Methylibium petroleiphilum]ABM96883.1 conserved hypothetical protein [Methylibium petroleiphilum PM1]
MKLEHIPEPRLRFASGEHICPRRGIAAYGVFDRSMDSRRTDVMIGGVGTATCIEALGRWVERCSSEIPAPETAKQPNLRVPFPGVGRGHAFDAKLVFGSDLARTLKKSEVDEIVAIGDRTTRLSKAIDLYYEHIKFLAQNRQIDAVVCVIPDALYKVVATEESNPLEETLDASVEVASELNFRRALKAKAMHLGKPLQLIRAFSLESNKKGQQDDATKAWNFCTALYYKAGPRVPWKLSADDRRPSSCAVGIAFYRSRDRQVLNTSLAQIFDELGNGLILRGTPIDMTRDDRVPHLNAQQAYDLLTAALNEYRVALRNFPARIVVHKSSNFSAEEIDGLSEAASDLRIDTVDLVTVMDSRLRLFREGNYPPYRGTRIEMDDRRHVLYSRGSVWYYKTYTGLYIPEPIELRIVRSEESPSFIAREILGLTKMNWNNTQFDGKYPVTLGCARKVGEIMKYLSDRDDPQIRYGFYM